MVLLFLMVLFLLIYVCVLIMPIRYGDGEKIKTKHVLDMGLLYSWCEITLKKFPSPSPIFWKTSTGSLFEMLVLLMRVHGFWMLFTSTHYCLQFQLEWISEEEESNRCGTGLGIILLRLVAGISNSDQNLFTIPVGKIPSPFYCS